MSRENSSMNLMFENFIYVFVNQQRKQLNNYKHSLTTEKVGELNLALDEIMSILKQENSNIKFANIYMRIGYIKGVIHNLSDNGFEQDLTLINSILGSMDGEAPENIY